jgi:AcrR family transcriptional regulator
MTQPKAGRDAGVTREALLNAAYDAVVAGDWDGTRMLDVATAAGVSRQTLYNEFGSKDALAQALAMREAQRFIDGTQRFLDEAHPSHPVDAVASATAWTLREASDNPLLKAALIDDAGGLLPFLTTRGEPLLAAARASIADYLHEHWPDLPRSDVDLAAEAVSRLTVSYLVLPSDAADASADAVAARLAHLVERLLSTASTEGSAP